jgi:hypothetical protein
MAEVALTNIEHGTEDGKVVRVAFGEPLKGLPADVVKELKDAGAVGSEKDAEALVETPKAMEAGSQVKEI